MKYKCNDISELLPCYVDNMTNQIESAMVSEHLAECAECRREYDFLKSIMETAHELPDINFSEDFNNKLHLNLVEAKKKKSKKAIASVRRIALATLSSAAVIAISIVSLSALDKKNIETIPTPKITAQQTQKDGAFNKKDVSSPDSALEESSDAPALENEAEETKEIETLAPNAESVTESAQETSKPKDDNVSNTTENVPMLLRGSSQSESPAVSEQPEENGSARRKTSSSKSGSDVYNLDSSGGSGGSPGGGSSSSYTGPEKTKVIATITTTSENKETVNNILSGYTYANGVYVLSSSEYSKVLGQLDSFGIYASLSKEDKTADYASLTAQLDGASKSEAASINSQLKQIDNEISKKYIKVN